MNLRSLLVATLWTIILFASGLLIPVIGQAVALFTPVPLMVAYVRHGRRGGMGALVVSAAVVYALAGWQAAAVLVFGFGLMAAGTAEGMIRRLRPERAVLLGGLLPVALLAAGAAYYFVHAGKSPVAALEQYMRDSIGEASKLYAGMGLKDTAEAITAVSDRFVYYFARLAPSLVILTAVVQAACCYGLTRFIILRKLPTGAVPQQPLFGTWYAPDTWVWALIASLALVALPFGSVRIIGWNLTLLFAVLYTIQGIAIAEYFLRKFGIPPALRTIMYVIVLALPLFMFLTALGVVDIWADFRKVRTQRQQ